MSCTCCSRTSNPDLPAFTFQSVYEGKQHASQSLRETGLCSSVTEEKPSVPLSKERELGVVPKRDGKQWLSCSEVKPKHRCLPTSRISRVEPVVKRFWFTKADLRTCWVLVKKSGCLYQNIHLFPRRNKGKEGMHGERVRVRTIILNALWRNKT